MAIHRTQSFRSPHPTSFLPQLLAVAIALVLAVPAVVPAQTQKPLPQSPANPGLQGEPKAAQTKSVTYPLYGMVVSITDKLLVIKGGKGKPDRKFDLTPATKFSAGKQPATLKDVKEGRWVGGSLRKSGAGNDIVVSLNVDVTQKGETKQADERKADPTPAPKKKSN
jgi:hypothetical protein